MTVRGHEPIVIEEINGLWSRGDDETCPSDHLLLANNIQFIHSGIETRTGILPYVKPSFPADLRKLVRVYNWTTQKAQTLVVMTEDGVIYHVISPTEVFQIRICSGADDFAFISIGNKAYISPFKIYTNKSGQTYALGMINECVYVYKGDQDPLTGIIGGLPAAGLPPTNANVTFPKGRAPMIGYNSVKDGKVTKGVHIISVCNNGGQGSPDSSPIVDAPGEKMIQLDHIPAGPAGTTTRTIIMTKAIPHDKFVSTPGFYNTQFYPVEVFNSNTETTFTLDISDAELEAKGLYVPTANPGTQTGALLVTNTDTVGFCDPGFHLLAVVYESHTGYLSAPGPEFFGGNTFINEKRAIKVSNIPTGPFPYSLKRHIVSTKTIPEYNGDQKGYQFFFVPKGTLENNTDTEIILNYYDSDLIADASHLMDNFGKIPAGVNFAEYHSRLVVVGDAHFPKDLAGVEDTKKSDNRSVAWVSAPGEPEAINQVDGLIVTPLDGNPLTNCQDFRDILYLFKSNRTYAVVDNQDEPTTWAVEVVDQGIGATVHGVADVLDSGGVNVDYLIVGDQSGLMLFNGTYARPELSWKIENLWMRFDKNLLHKLQIANDSIRKKIWITYPGNTSLMFLADYNNGLDPKNVRWALWDFGIIIMTSLSLHKNDKLVLATTVPDDPAFRTKTLAMIRSEVPGVWPPWDDEAYPPEITPPPYPWNEPVAPLPNPTNLGGGLAVLDPYNQNRFDRVLDTNYLEVDLPIKIAFRTAFLGG